MDGMEFWTLCLYFSGVLVFIKNLMIDEYVINLILGFENLVFLIPDS